MRIKKSFLIIISFVMLFCSSLPLNAADVSAKNDDFEKYIDKCFLDSNNIQVTSKTGENITEEFLRVNDRFYKGKNYSEIKAFIRENVAEIIYITEEIEDSKSVYALSRAKTVIGEKLVLLEADGPLTDFYAKFKVSGTFWYEPNTGQITSVGATRVYDISYIDKPAGIFMSEYNKVANPGVIYDNGYKVRFTGRVSFAAYADAEGLILSEDYGAFSLTVTGQAD